jgi:hypothetical protein
MRWDLGMNPADDRFDRFTDDGAAIALATGRRSAAAGPGDCDDLDDGIGACFGHRDRYPRDRTEAPARRGNQAEARAVRPGPLPTQRRRPRQKPSTAC